MLYSLRLATKGGECLFCMQDCIFCKIIKKEIPSDIVYENEDFLVFKDINPFGPVSLLVIPKVHVETIVDLSNNGELLEKLMKTGLEIVREYDLQNKGFAFHINGGGVQEVNHLHLKIGGAWENKDCEGYPEW